jgi:hypothetical protein
MAPKATKKQINAIKDWLDQPKQERCGICPFDVGFSPSTKSDGEFCHSLFPRTQKEQPWRYMSCCEYQHPCDVYNQKYVYQKARAFVEKHDKCFGKD